MDHLSFAALGFFFIGLITTGVIAWFTLRRVSSPHERQHAIRWSAAFGLPICTFMSATPLLQEEQLWFLILPFAGTCLSLDSLHRTVGNFRKTTSTPPSNSVFDGSARRSIDIQLIQEMVTMTFLRSDRRFSKMNRIPTFLILLSLLLSLLLAGCGDSGYTQVSQKEMGGVFIMNSSPTFQGYYYEGSDRDFHYFTSRWKYESDRKVKIRKSDLKIAEEFDFGSQELGLTVLNASNSGPVFCEIEDRPIYVKEKNE